MASLPNWGVESESFHHRDLKWYQEEKAVARKAFQQALQREFEIVMNETRRRAARIKEPSYFRSLEDGLGRKAGRTLTAISITGIPN